MREYESDLYDRPVKSKKELEIMQAIESYAIENEITEYGAMCLIICHKMPIEWFKAFAHHPNHFSAVFASIRRISKNKEEMAKLKELNKGNLDVYLSKTNKGEN